MPSLARPALLFDLDGTLINSLPDLRVAVNATLAEDGLPSFSDAEVATMVGNGAKTLIQRAYRAAGAELASEDATENTLQRFLTHYEAAPAVLTHVYDGVPETLAQLQQQGYQLAICTNKPHAPTLEILSALKLDPYFSVVQGAGLIPELKPHPAPLLATLDKMAETPQNAIMIGDSHNDSQAAQAAGIPCICVTFGYRHGSLDSLGADRLIDHFADLPAAIKSLG